MGQSVNVFAINGRDEAAIKPDQDLMRDVVCFGFESGELDGAVLDGKGSTGDLADHGGALAEEFCLRQEHIEELLVGRDQLEHRRPVRSVVGSIRE